MSKEVNIIKIIRSIRYLKLAMRQVLPKNVRADAKKRSQYVVLNGGDDEVQGVIL